jgi:glutaredoxin-dependent peroxiredoxin
MEESMSVEVGQKAPDFTLSDQDGRPTSLGAQRGRNVVLAFFPAAFTSVCTKELCTFRDSLPELNNANAVVFGISSDTASTLKDFAVAERLNFPLLADPERVAIESYGVANPDKGGLKAKRAVFVVDGEGTVRHKEVTAHPGLEPDYEKVHDALGQLAQR